MNKKTLGVAVALLLTVVVAAAVDDPLEGRHYQPPPGHNLEYTVYSSRVDGVGRSTVIKAELCFAEPDWGPETESAPPLTIPNAVAAARAVLKTTVRDAATWQLNQVGLERCGKEHWLYIVRWDSSVNGSDYLIVPVLLSGTALSPNADDEPKQVGGSPSN